MFYSAFFFFKRNDYIFYFQNKQISCLTSIASLRIRDPRLFCNSIQEAISILRLSNVFRNLALSPPFLYVFGTKRMKPVHI